MIAVTVSLHLQPRAVQVGAELEQAMNTPGEDLGPAALAIARVEYPSLEAGPYLDLLDRMGEEASTRIGAPGQSPFEDAVRAFNEYLYDEQGFSGNRERYDDPRNSFLNEVLEPPDGHSDQPRGRVSGGGAPRRPPRGRRELPGALPPARSAHARTGGTRRRGDAR